MSEALKRIRAIQRKQRRDARAAADEFAKIYAEGRIQLFERAVARLDEEVLYGWPLAIRRVAKLSSVSAKIQRAFLQHWIQSKMLASSIGNRPALAAALRVLLPRHTAAAELTLFRGAAAAEARRRAYGFSWTTDIEIARMFARRMNGSGGERSVVLRTVAPVNAILLQREAEDFYDEAEVIVDPFALRRVTRVELLEPGDVEKDTDFGFPMDQ